MSMVAIIGAGDLGGAAAQALASRDRIGRIVLIDAAAKAAAGKALDIRQSGAVDAFHTRLDATDDLSSVTGAAACIVADRFGAPVAEWQGDEGLAMLARLVPYLSGAPLVFAGAQQAGLMLQAAREGGVARHRLVGSAPEALASAVRSIVALEAQCSPAEVMLAVLGTPGPRLPAEAPAGSEGGFVVPWSEASIGGYALERVLTQVQLTRVEARAAHLWPPGPYTLGVAAARAAEAIVTGSRRHVSALILLGGEFGVRNRIGALPVLLNEQGIAGVRVPTLNTRERVAIETSLGAP
jgi:malate dehydrogenase